VSRAADLYAAWRAACDDEQADYPARRWLESPCGGNLPLAEIPAVAAELDRLYAVEQAAVEHRQPAPAGPPEPTAEQRQAARDALCLRRVAIEMAARREWERAGKAWLAYGSTDDDRYRGKDEPSGLCADFYAEIRRKWEADGCLWDD